MILLALLLIQERHGAAVAYLEVSPEGRSLVSGGWDGRARGWEADTLRSLWSTDARPGTIYGARFSPDGATLATFNGQGPIKLWKEGVLQRSLDGLQTGHGRLAFSRDGRCVLALTFRGELRAWDVGDGRELLHEDLKLPNLEELALAPERWAWASMDGLRIVDLQGRKEIRPARRRGDGAAERLEFSPDGTRLAVARADGTIEVLDASGVSKLHLRGLRGRVCAMAFSRDNALLAAGDNEREARVWRIDGPERLRTFAAEATVTGLSFSPDAKTLYVGDADGRVISISSK